MEDGVEGTVGLWPRSV